MATQVRKCNAHVVTMPWRNNSGTVDTGVYVMRHMETYFGEREKDWECGLRPKEQRAWKCCEWSLQRLCLLLHITQNLEPTKLKPPSIGWISRQSSASKSESRIIGSSDILMGDWKRFLVWYELDIFFLITHARRGNTGFVAWNVLEQYTLCWKMSLYF